MRCGSPTTFRSGSRRRFRHRTFRACSISFRGWKRVCSPSICRVRVSRISFRSAARRIRVSGRRSRVGRRWSFTATGKRFTSNIEIRLGQIKWNGQTTASIFNHISARPIPEYTLLDLIVRAEKESESLPKVAEGLASGRPVQAEPIIPLKPREVWACGCTYEMSAAFRDAEHGTREGFYAQVYRGERPEIFFKGTSRVCVGPGQTIGIRSDSHFTAPEPELALVLGSAGSILGYTLANDVSAWDIERENPLYLTQSKIYAACCALGPVIVTASEIPDPKNLDMTCRITRGDKVIFEGGVNTARLG